MNNDEVRKEWVVTSLSIQLGTKKIKDGKLTPQKAFENLETHLFVNELYRLPASERQIVTDEEVKNRGLFSTLNQLGELYNAFRDSIASHMLNFSKACIETDNSRSIALDILNMALEIHVTNEVRQSLLLERQKLLESKGSNPLSEEKYKLRGRLSGNIALSSIRWLLALPIAVLAAILVTFPLHWILYMTLSGGPAPFITPYPALPEKLLQPFCSAFAFVYTCAFVAPRYRVRVAKIAIILWCVVAFLSVILVLSQIDFYGGLKVDYWGIPIILGVLGAFVGFGEFKRRFGETKKGEALILSESRQEIERKKAIYRASYERLTDGLPEEEIIADKELLNLRACAGIDDPIGDVRNGDGKIAHGSRLWLKIIRFLLFIPLCFFVMAVVNWCLGKLLLWFMELSKIWLIIVVIFLGSTIWSLFKMLASILTLLVSYIAPTKWLSNAVISILSIANGSILTHSVWTIKDNYSGWEIAGAVVATFLILELTIALIYGAAATNKQED